MKTPETKFGWVMDYPGKDGFWPEITNLDGETVKRLPKAYSREAGVRKLKEWAENNRDVSIILMKDGIRL